MLISDYGDIDANKDGIIQHSNINNDKRALRLFVSVYSTFTYFSFIKGDDWNIIRLIWIAYYQNNTNKTCYFKNLPKDIIFDIIDLLTVSFFDDNDEWKVDIN